MSDLTFYAGNFIAIIGGFFALAWVMTNRRFYGRRRHRGLAAVVFLAVGIFMMLSAHREADSSPTKSPHHGNTQTPATSH